MPTSDPAESEGSSAQRVRTASAQRRAQARDDLRAKILAAAAELFVERGHEGMSMRQLAERIGYTPATIYLHFENKDALLFALLDEGYRDFGERMAAAAAEPDPLARLETLGRTYIAFGLENPTHYQLMFMRRADFLQAKLAARADHIDAFEVLQTAVAQALAAGVLQPANPLAASIALWSTVHGLIGLLLIAPTFEPAMRQEIIDTTLRTLLTGIAARG
jgi:AcrR family transcriptional regulator